MINQIFEAWTKEQEEAERRRMLVKREAEVVALYQECYVTERPDLALVFIMEMANLPPASRRRVRHEIAAWFRSQGIDPEAAIADYLRQMRFH